MLSANGEIGIFALHYTFTPLIKRLMKKNQSACLTKRTFVNRVTKTQFFLLARRLNYAEESLFLFIGRPLYALTKGGLRAWAQLRPTMGELVAQHRMVHRKNPRI